MSRYFGRKRLIETRLTTEDTEDARCFYAKGFCFSGPKYSVSRRTARITVRGSRYTSRARLRFLQKSSFIPMNYDAILVTSFGGPEQPADVMPFLENVLR